MAWLDDFGIRAAARDRADEVWRLPLGAASPLWAMFGAAAGAGVVWWWLTRWTRPVNVEAQLAPVGEPATDDLTRLKGVGPKLAAALAGRGVTRFAEIAGWTQDDLARMDAALALRGRAVREHWVEQARRLTES